MTAPEVVAWTPGGRMSAGALLGEAPTCLGGSATHCRPPGSPAPNAFLTHSTIFLISPPREAQCGEGGRQGHRPRPLAFLAPK